ncbi:MAG: hypothetical protein J5814_00215 [Bacteroidaceae bacterium]|nr:hypothetical protein [Bacteroidaceae bacterium]
MKYDIFSNVAPAMPKPSKGTECVSLLLSQASKDMREPLVPMIFPALAAHLSDVKFMYCDNKWHELCGQMGHLIGPSGIGKAQLTHLIEAVMRSFRAHDEEEYRKLTDWQRQVKTRGANKEKPERPEVSFWFPPADLTNPAFIQNAMACEKLGARTQYLNLPEVEMADRMCGGHKQVSQTVRNIYDRQRAGALRATADGVTGNPILRVNITFSSTPDAARTFYRKDLTNGFFSRIPFAYKARGERMGRIPRQGQYGEEFLAQLDEYLERLDSCRGHFVVKPLNLMADLLAKEMAQLADLADDDVLFELSHRSIFAAWKKAATLWIMNDQTWTQSIGEYMRWFCYYDLWSKVRVFGDMFKSGDVASEGGHKTGPQNMLDGLPDTFNEAQLGALRLQMGKDLEGTKNQLYKWVFRKFVTYDPLTGLYTKTDKYRKGAPAPKGKGKIGGIAEL